MPTTRMATINSVVATGLKTNMRDGFMCWLVRVQRSSRRPTARGSAAAGRPATRRTEAAGPTLAVPAAATGALRLVLVLGLRLRAGLGHFGGGGIRQLHRSAIAQAVAAVGHHHVTHV